MDVEHCPKCKHMRAAHDQDGNCFRLVELVPAGFGVHLAVCGACGWAPYINRSGSAGWRYADGVGPVVMPRRDETVEAAIAEVERLLRLA